jgi:hypothetical protein
MFCSAGRSTRLQCICLTFDREGVDSSGHRPDMLGSEGGDVIHATVQHGFDELAPEVFHQLVDPACAAERQRPRGAHTRLHHPVHGAVVRLLGDIAAGVGDDVDLEARIDGREGRADDADRGPQPGEDHSVLANPVHVVRDVAALPGVALPGTRRPV